MARRASAFATDLAELDNLQSLPMPAGIGPSEVADVQPPTLSEGRPQSRGLTAALGEPQDQVEVATSAAAQPTQVPEAPQGGTRATQVRLPPSLAAWLGEEAHRTKKTLSTVVALAARAHRQALPVSREASDGLDVSRRVASGTVPVTLRLTGAQRQLLDEIAGDYTATRSAVVVAALGVAAALPKPDEGA